MKKMKKMVSLALTAAMTAGLMTGMGALTASADSERTKITALLKGTESTEQFQTFDYLLKNFCDEKGLDYEIELVNDMQDYFTKLQMYILLRRATNRVNRARCVHPCRQSPALRTPRGSRQFRPPPRR